MNRCVTHNQEYDPASGWCVYCGKPGGVRYWASPTYPVQFGYTCPSCGSWVNGWHACWSVLPYTFTSNTSVITE